MRMLLLSVAVVSGLLAAQRMPVVTPPKASAVEALAQRAGTNTFYLDYFDEDGKLWKVMGAREAGAPVFELGPKSRGFLEL